MLNDEELDIFNETLRIFVEEELTINDYFSLEALEYTEQLLNIFKKDMPNFELRKYKHKVPLKESIENALLFLGNLKDEYGKYLETRIADGTINFYTKKEAHEQDIYDSFSTYRDDKRVINIIYNETFEDVYTIIHELFHDMNLIISDYYTYKDEVRDALSETVSILATKLATEYYKKVMPNKKELDIDLSLDYKNLAYFCNIMDFLIEIIKIYYNKRAINNFDIMSILKDKSDDYKEIVETCIKEEIITDETFNLFTYEGYLTAHMITNYIINTYSNPEQILIELNELITENSIEDVFSYLDLYIDVDLDKGSIRIEDDSVKKIEESFKTQVKKIY